ncbi:glycosyltransferase, partial [Streptomyces sp. SID14478]|uniref:glycosyltransferase n=1 Tax=Streptomyces sp. SID14478 TaxID=2706073 RepID=UPI0013DAFFFE
SGQAPGGVEAEADRFATALYGLAELARDEGVLGFALRSESAVRILERACRAPGALRAARAARVPDLLAFAGYVERALRPLSLDWYEDASAGFEGGGLGSVDLCHATSGGAAALPGLIAKRFFGVPLLVTEYGVQLRARYIAAGDAELSAPVRALLASFHGLLAAEVYRQAAVITPGNTHARRWQERCGADRAKLRTVHPGMEAARFADVGEREEPGEPDTLVWVGRIDPSKDLISLLHAFAEIRKDEPKARLRIVGALPAGRAAGGAGQDGAGDPAAEEYLGHCKGLAAQLFPDEAEGMHAVGENPVSFEELGGPEAPDLAAAYGAGSIVVLSSVVEGFPISLVEAMFCGRATVSTDVGAVVEVIGGTGLVVPPRNPRALAEACVALLRDSERRERLGAAARARALELFTIEQNIAAFRGIYLEIVSHCPVRREAVDDAGEPLPFAHPPEAHVPGRWTATAVGGGGGAWLAGRSSGTGTPSWASDADGDEDDRDAPGDGGADRGSADRGGEREQLAGVTQGCGEADG